MVLRGSARRTGFSFEKKTFFPGKLFVFLFVRWQRKKLPNSHKRRCRFPATAELTQGEYDEKPRAPRDCINYAVPLPQHLARRTACGRSTVLGSAHEACLSKLPKTCKSLVPAAFSRNLFPAPAGDSPPAQKLGCWPSQDPRARLSAIAFVSGGFHRIGGVRCSALAPIRNEPNRCASVVGLRAFTGQRLTACCWRLLRRCDGLRSSPEVISTAGEAAACRGVLCGGRTGW